MFSKLTKSLFRIISKENKKEDSMIKISNLYLNGISSNHKNIQMCISYICEYRGKKYICNSNNLN